MSVRPASSHLYSDALTREIAADPKCSACLDVLTSLLPSLSLSADPTREDKKSTLYQELKAVLQPLTAEVARIAFRNQSLHNLRGYVRSLQTIVGDRSLSTGRSNEALLKHHIPKRLLRSAIDRYLQPTRRMTDCSYNSFSLAMQESFAGMIDPETVKGIFLRVAMARSYDVSSDDDSEEAFMKIHDDVMANNVARRPAERPISSTG